MSNNFSLPHSISNEKRKCFGDWQETKLIWIVYNEQWIQIFWLKLNLVTTVFDKNVIPTHIHSTSIRLNKRKEVSSLYHIPKVITVRHFLKIVIFRLLRVERFKLWTSFVSFHSASQTNAATKSENFAPFLSNHVINNILFYFLPKTQNFFKMRNLPPSLDILHVDLRISRALLPYLGSVSMYLIIKGFIP